MSKYDYLSLKCFGVVYIQLTNEQQIAVIDEYENKNE
jgi:hypothetical protein